MGWPFPKVARFGIVGLLGLISLYNCVLPLGAKDQVGSEKQGADTASAHPVKRASSLDELFAKYEIYAEHRKRSQGAIHAQIIAHEGVVDFLLSKLHIDLTRTSTAEEIQSRRKAAHLAGNFKRHTAELVPALLNCLEDDDEVRQAATQSLGQLGEDAGQAIPMLIEELHFENNFAGTALSQIAPRSNEVFQAILTAALDSSKEPMFRSQTIHALRTMKVRNAGYTNALERLSVEEDDQIKSAALFLLGRPAAQLQMNVEGPNSKPSTNDLPVLIERVRKNSDDFQAVHSLRQLGSGALPALPVMIEVLEQRKGRFPANFPSIIAEMGSAASNAVPVLISCLADDDRGLFNNSVIALGKIGPAAMAAKPMLIPLLDDPDPAIRWQAAHALRKIDPNELDRCLPILFQPLRDGSAEYYQVNALADLPEHQKEVADVLRKLIKETQTPLMAMDTLLRLDPTSGPELVPTLMNILQDRPHLNRRPAATLLGKIGAPARPALPILQQAANDDDPALAEIARESIRQIEQNSH